MAPPGACSGVVTLAVHRWHGECRLGKVDWVQRAGAAGASPAPSFSAGPAAGRSSGAAGGRTWVKGPVARCVMGGAPGSLREWGAKVRGVQNRLGPFPTPHPLPKAAMAPHPPSQLPSCPPCVLHGTVGPPCAPLIAFSSPSPRPQRMKRASQASAAVRLPAGTPGCLSRAASTAMVVSNLPSGQCRVRTHARSEVSGRGWP
jgi:hypothetical protein